MTTVICGTSMAIVLAFLGVISFAVVAVLCMTLYALVKPHMSGLTDRWCDWFYRRTRC